MNAAQAKRIPLTDILARLGHPPRPEEDGQAARGVMNCPLKISEDARGLSRKNSR